MLEYIEKHKVKFLYAPMFVYWLILLTATSLPAKDLPNTGVNDKIEHFSAYLILSLLLAFALSIQKRYKKARERSSLYTLIIVGIYAAADEIHQLFIPGRDCQFGDWVADFLAAIIAVAVIGYIFRRFAKKPADQKSV